MHLVDLAAAMAALRHARKPVVTASVDSLHFIHPVRIGQLIVLRSSVNRVFRTSMEVGVQVETENLLTGEKLHTCSAYLTFVALGEDRTANRGTAGHSGNGRGKTALPRGWTNEENTVWPCANA